MTPGWQIGENTFEISNAISRGFHGVIPQVFRLIAWIIRISFRSESQSGILVRWRTPFSQNSSLVFVLTNGGLAQCNGGCVRVADAGHKEGTTVPGMSHLIEPCIDHDGGRMTVLGHPQIRPQLLRGG